MVIHTAVVRWDSVEPVDLVCATYPPAGFRLLAYLDPRCAGSIDRARSAAGAASGLNIHVRTTAKLADYKPLTELPMALAFSDIPEGPYLARALVYGGLNIQGKNTYVVPVGGEVAASEYADKNRGPFFVCASGAVKALETFGHPDLLAVAHSELQELIAELGRVEAAQLIGEGRPVRNPPWGQDFEVHTSAPHAAALTIALAGGLPLVIRGGNAHQHTYLAGCMARALPKPSLEGGEHIARIADLEGSLRDLRTRPVISWDLSADTNKHQVPVDVRASGGLLLLDSPGQQPIQLDQCRQVLPLGLEQPLYVVTNADTDAPFLHTPALVVVLGAAGDSTETIKASDIAAARRRLAAGVPEIPEYLPWEDRAPAVVSALLGGATEAQSIALLQALTKAVAVAYPQTKES